MVNAHSIACVLLAGYVFALVMRFGHAALGLGFGFVMRDKLADA
jgi:hypothetical protein